MAIDRTINLNYVGVDRASKIADKIKAANDRMARAGVRGYRMMATAAKAVASASLTIAAGAVAGVAAMGTIAGRAANSIDIVLKKSQALGIEANTWNQLTYAADKFGASAEGVAVAFRTLAMNVGRGVDMTAEAKRAFAQLNIEMTDVIGQSSEKVFYKIADAIKNTTDKTKALSAAQALLGRSAIDILPLLQEGGKGIQSAMAGGAKFQINIDDEVVQKVGKMKDAMLRMKTAWQNIWLKVGVSVMEPAAQLADGMADKFRDVADYLRAAMDRLLNLMGGYKDGAKSLGDSIIDMLKKVFRFMLQASDAAIRLQIKTVQTVLRGMAEPLAWIAKLGSFEKLGGLAESMQTADLMTPYESAKQSIEGFFDAVDKQFKEYQTISENASRKRQTMEQRLKAIHGTDYERYYGGGLGDGGLGLGAALGGSAGTFQYDAASFGQNELVAIQKEQVVEQKKLVDEIKELKEIVKKQEQKVDPLLEEIIAESQEPHFAWNATGV